MGPISNFEINKINGLNKLGPSRPKGIGELASSVKPFQLSQPIFDLNKPPKEPALASAASASGAVQSPNNNDNSLVFNPKADLTSPNTVASSSLRLQVASTGKNLPYDEREKLAKREPTGKQFSAIA